MSKTGVWNPIPEVLTVFIAKSILNVFIGRTLMRKLIIYELRVEDYDSIRLKFLSMEKGAI